MSADATRPILQHIVQGHGPERIIALHSLFADGQSFLPMVEAMDQERWSVALPDIRGYGRSRDLDGPYDLATVAADALALADQLGWDEFAVLGHSMGGKAALRLALDAPRRVSHIIGLSPIWAGTAAFAPDALAKFRSSADVTAEREAVITRTTGARLPAGWYRNAAAASAANSRREAYAGYLESLVADDFEAAALAIDRPVMVIAGAHDPGNVEVARSRWARLRNAELTVLTDCGHWPILELPLLTAALVERFLTDH